MIELVIDANKGLVVAMMFIDVFSAWIMAQVLGAPCEALAHVLGSLGTLTKDLEALRLLKKPIAHNKDPRRKNQVE